MDYVLAFLTLVVVFVVPAAIIAGLVAQPERRADATVPPSTAAPSSAAETPH